MNEENQDYNKGYEEGYEIGYKAGYDDAKDEMKNSIRSSQRQLSPKAQLFVFGESNLKDKRVKDRKRWNISSEEENNDYRKKKY